MERLGDYAIGAVLGEGGSAIVYEARKADETSSEPAPFNVALKVLRQEVAATERQRERFLDEARMLARVDHDNVIKVLDAGLLPDGRPFLAMPRLTGGTLATALARGRLPITRAVALFEKITDAIIALHEVGLVHRDLKPENIALEGDEPVVLDLGIAREADAAPSTTTEEGIVRGTPATMAPERLFGARASIGSDVYELALLFYAMLVGGLPWNDATDVDARLSARPPREVVGAIPLALSDAIMVALSTRVERRPKSARELLKNVQAALAAGDETRRTADAPTPLRVSAKSELLPLTESTTDRAPRGEATTARPPPANTTKHPTRARPTWIAASVAALALAAVGVRALVHSAPPPVSEATSAAPASLGVDSPVATASASASSAVALSAAVSASAAPPLVSSVATTQPIVPVSPASTARVISSDPLAPCREINALYCRPEQAEKTMCGFWKNLVRADETRDHDGQVKAGAECAADLPQIKKELREKLDRFEGRKTTFFGKTSDAELDALGLAGCGYWRRHTCAFEGEHSLQCQNIIHYIDDHAHGNAAQIKELRMFCSIDASREKEQKAEHDAAVKAKQGGASGAPAPQSSASAQAITPRPSASATSAPLAPPAPSSP
jgi:serine/threonine-protein kinase